MGKINEKKRKVIEGVKKQSEKCGFPVMEKKKNVKKK